MNLEEIKKFFEENKDNEDVKSYLKGLSQLTPDGVSAFLDLEEGKKLIQPKLDSYFTKGLETWKSNNLKKLVDEEVKKQNPTTNPLEKQLEDLKRELLLKDLKAKAKDVASEQKLPLKLVDYFVGEDEDSTFANLKTLQEVFDTHINERVQEQLKDGGINPQLNNQNNNTTVNMSPTQLMSMAYSQSKN